MQRAVDYLEQEPASMRTGRASPGDCLAVQAAWIVPAFLLLHQAYFDCKLLILLQSFAGLLDSLKVQVHGQRMPLKAAASISVRDTHSFSHSV